VVLVYSILFGTGSLIFGDITSTLVYIFAAIISIIIIYKNLQHIGWVNLIK
jgi:solute:Na+ symporter, SSS family